MIYSLTSDGEHLRTMCHNMNMWRTPPDIVTQQSVTLNGWVHMEANPLRMLSLLRRTHAVQLFIYIIVQFPIPAILWPQRRQSRPRKTPFPRRQVLPCTLAFRASKTFRASTPASSGIPLIRTPGLAQLLSHGFPSLHPNVPWSSYPERAGIPMLNGSCHSSLGSSEHPPAILLYGSPVHTMRQN